MAERVKKVTMEDIAVKMNVSRALVSYALADKYGVSERDEEADSDRGS